MTETTVGGSHGETAPPRPLEVDPYSGLMLRLLSAWIVFVVFLSFVTVPWLKAGNGGDLTDPMIWFYHAIMIPTAALFLILCTRVFTLHPWARYVVTRGAIVAVFESIGLLVRGYGELHNVAPVAALGTWIDLPCTLVMFLLTAVFLIGLVATTFIPRAGKAVSRQKIEITWALFLSGVSAMTWVLFGMIYSASEVGINFGFWASTQKEPLSSLLGNMVTSHSHGMLPAFMAGIVLLAAEAFGYSRLGGARKQVARAGVGVMLAGVALFSGLYFIAGLGSYSIPTWFPFGPGGVNGMAMDDTMTGLVGVGTLILAAAMLPEVRQGFSRLGSAVARRFNPVRASVYLTYVMATAAMFLYGFYIEMNESQFGFAALPASRAINDQIFTRSHLLFVFGALPVMAVLLVAAEIAGDTSRVGVVLRRWMSAFMVAGMVVTLVGMGIWVFSTPGHQASWAAGSAGEVAYITGQALMLVGAVIELFTVRSANREQGADLGVVRAGLDPVGQPS